MEEEQTTQSNHIQKKKVKYEYKLSKAFSTCIIDPLHPTAVILELVFLLRMLG